MLGSEGETEGKKEGRDRGMRGINRGCGDEQGKWRDEKRGAGCRDGEMVKNRLPGGGLRQALKDRAATRPKGSTLAPNLGPGASGARQEVSLLLASFLSFHVLFHSLFFPLPP